ncbi:MAG TPA: ADOP family duplicated permease [Gemmatimonadales bacterium]|nr:ADOP family duplicated permease [Gemmatimonadales bacterium]
MAAAVDWPRRFYYWIRALVLRTRLERDLEREIRLHVQMEIDNNLDAGMSPVEAQRHALIAFGGLERHREAVRDERGTRWLDDIVTDLRYAVRSLRKRPGFVAIAVGTLALGIGATTAVFALADWTLFRPVPGTTAPRQLVMIEFMADYSPLGASAPTIDALQRTTNAFGGLIGIAAVDLQLAGAGISPESQQGEAVAGDYFGVLGVTPERGRFFTLAERDPAANVRVAIISDRLWRGAFGGVPDIVGRQIRVNAESFTVVGVTPADFHGVERLGQSDLWFPACAYPWLRHAPPSVQMTDPTYRAFEQVVGRLRPGVSAAAAQVQVRQAIGRLIAGDTVHMGIYAGYPATVLPGLGLMSLRRPAANATVRLLFAIVGFVLLIACANTANLLLLRGLRRRGELAVRRALGASRLRVLQQHVVEGVVIGALGGGAGLVVAFVISQIFRGESLPPLSYVPIERIPMDARVLGFGMALALATGAMFGLIAGLLTSGKDFLAHLGDAARGSGRSTAHLRTAFTVVQIGATTVLLVTTLLFAQTLHHLRGVSLGYQVEQVTQFRFDPTLQNYTPGRLTVFRRELLDRLAARPGIVAASISTTGPFSPSFWIDLGPTGFAGKEWPVHAVEFSISPDFFRTFDQPLLRGRTFTVAEAEGDSTGIVQPIILSQGAARNVFGTDDVIGRQVVEREYRTRVTHTIIGVVGDTRATDLRGAPEPSAYEPVGTTPFALGLTLFVKSRLPEHQVATTVQGVFHELDPELPIADVQPMSRALAGMMGQERLFARLVSLLALLAVFLAAVGLYGLIAYAVAERTREIGVRMALGARGGPLVAMIVGQVGRLVVVGLALGLAVALFFSRLFQSRLFGVSPLNAVSYIVAAVVIVMIGAAASAQPTWTATRVNPIEALRHD